MGKPGFPTSLPRRGMGKPGFPIPPPGGRVGEGAALEEGNGEARFPHAPAPQGDGETGFPHPPTPRKGLGGRSPPRNSLFYHIGVRRSRMDGGEGSGPLKPSPLAGGSGQA